MNSAREYRSHRPKATFVADSTALACHIRTALVPRGGKPCTSATVLGVDTVADRSRCAARRSTRAARFARCHTRRTRLLPHHIRCQDRPICQPPRTAPKSPGPPLARSVTSGSSPLTPSAPKPEAVPLQRPASLTKTLMAASGALPPSAGHTKPGAPLRTTPKRSVFPTPPTPATAPVLKPAHIPGAPPKAHIFGVCLEPQRLGWSRPIPFEFVDSEGNAHHLFHVSSNTVRQILHRATLNSLAMQLVGFQDPRRVLVEPVVGMIRPSNFSARQKGVIATVLA